MDWIWQQTFFVFSYTSIYHFCPRLFQHDTCVALHLVAFPLQCGLDAVRHRNFPHHCFTSPCIFIFCHHCFFFCIYMCFNVLITFLDKFISAFSADDFLHGRNLYFKKHHHQSPPPSKKKSDQAMFRFHLCLVIIISLKQNYIK